jgi:hypothetical protein
MEREIMEREVELELNKAMKELASRPSVTEHEKTCERQGRRWRSDGKNE